MSAVPAILRRPARPATPAPARGERHLRVVRQAKRRHTLAFVLGVLLLTAGVVFAAVSLNALAAGDAVRAADLERQVLDAERRYERLIAQVAELENPARIQQVASEQLGMVPATSPRYLPVSRPLPADGYVVELLPAGGATEPLKPLISAEK